MNSENYKINNKALKYFRGIKRYSQEELASRCGVDTNTVSRWEIGTSNPRLKRQEILVKVLGVTVEQLRDPPPIKQKSESRTKSTISESAQVALDLVSDTYHINKDAIIDFAPFIFHALAAASLDERAIRLAKVDTAIDELREYSKEKLPYMPGGGLSIIERSMEGGGLLIEKEAINDNHLFFSCEISDDAHDISTNPFSQFIKPFLDSIPEKFNKKFNIEWRNDELPKFHITDSYIRELLLVPVDDDLFEKIKELFFNGEMALKDINIRDCGLSAKYIEENRDGISHDLKEKIMKKYIVYTSSKKTELGEGK